MRRPTPLPPPPPRPERQPEPERWAGEDDVVDATPVTTGADASDGAATAPIVPFEVSPRRDGEESDRDADPFVHPADSGSVEHDAQQLRARDVWAAARARRRALRAEVRRFTARQRHRRMVWIGVVVALVLLVLGSVGAAYSPLFAVERVRVVGTSQLDAAAVEQALSAQIGRPLPLVDSSEVKAALVGFPLVESYTLEARPPHDLMVRIVERTPIGALKSAAGYTVVDAAGVALVTTDERPDDHPVITVTGGVGSKAFAAIGTVYRSLPDDIRAQVTAMKATTPNDVTLRLGATDTDVVWGSATDSAEKAVVLERIMASQPPSKVTEYDVSSPSAVVVR